MLQDHFRLGQLHEQQSQPKNNLSPLRGTKIEYKNSTAPVAVENSMLLHLH